ncbi:hypothetical protein C7293_12680 [filamentous cyanobacterium CCT1]|nr:hypothetical protein C7293_12680 [filamentous cyanobacterium CCT1]PSN80538.1 hypothetical protein C8B47_05960 [filamentous cyanobacterium CCP4]
MTQPSQFDRPEEPVNTENELLDEQNLADGTPDLDCDLAENQSSSTMPDGDILLPLPMDFDLPTRFVDECIAREVAKLDATFGEIFSRESSSARSLFPFIRGKLIQYRLWPLYDEIAILQEVYARTIEKILEGRKITNQYGWIRSVSFRYIRELNRKQGRSTGVDESFLETLMPVEEIDEESLTDEMLKIQRAFQELSSEERLLLSLKTVQDLSWSEIQQIWIEKGYGNLSIPALRKRKERALSHLRMLYHSM